VSSASALALAGGCLAAVAAAEGGGELALAARKRLPRVAELARALERLGADGREPGAAERRRALAAAAALALVVGAMLAGPAAGVALACAAPWSIGRLLRARRERYRQSLERDAPAIAVALADALSGGHSLRGALAEAAAGVPGAGGRELRRVAGELALGARTDRALEALGRRAGSHAIDAIVAACLLQRRAGGDLARLLRESARGFEDEARLAAEVRAATAQARFTGLIVVLLPLGGALLAELANPGFVRGLADSLLTAWLVGLAVALQAIAAVAIRRLGRPRE
jgi:tight adherence protein B